MAVIVPTGIQNFTKPLTGLFRKRLCAFFEIKSRFIACMAGLSEAWDGVDNVSDVEKAADNLKAAQEAVKQAQEKVDAANMAKIQSDFEAAKQKVDDANKKLEAAKTLDSKEAANAKNEFFKANLE